MTTIRTFLAVELPPELRSAVGDLQQELKRRLSKDLNQHARIQWVKPDLIHLTMKFLGETEAEMVEPLRESLAQSLGSFGGVTIPLGRLGAFPNRHGPRVLWVGPSDGFERGEDAKRLDELHRMIERICEGLGFAGEPKSFAAHLTVARIKDGERLVGQALARSGAADQPLLLGTLPIESVVLMKSDLRPNGPVYSKLWEVRLRNEQ